MPIFAGMSRAFVNEDNFVEDFPDRRISEQPNFVTEAGLALIERAGGQDDAEITSIALAKAKNRNLFRLAGRKVAADHRVIPEQEHDHHSDEGASGQKHQARHVAAGVIA